MTYELTPDDRRSLALHRALVPHLPADPERVFAIARDDIARWSPNHRPDGAAVRYLREWEALMDQGVDAVIEMPTSTGERACTLRPNSPFAGVLSDEERLAVLQTVRRGEPYVPSFVVSDSMTCTARPPGRSRCQTGCRVTRRDPSTWATSRACGR